MITIITIVLMIHWYNDNDNNFHHHHHHQHHHHLSNSLVPVKWFPTLCICQPGEASMGVANKSWSQTQPGIEWNGWDGMGWDGMEWNGIEWNGTEWMDGYMVPRLIQETWWLAELDFSMARKPTGKTQIYRSFFSGVFWMFLWTNLLLS